MRTPYVTEFCLAYGIKDSVVGHTIDSYSSQNILLLAVLNKYALHNAVFFVVVVVLFLFMCWKLLITSTDESKEASRSYRVPAVRKVSRLCCLRVCFMYFLGSVIICRLYKLTLLCQAQVTPQLRVSLYDYVWRFSSLDPCCGGRGCYFLRGPNRLSVALIIT